MLVSCSCIEEFGTTATVFDFSSRQNDGVPLPPYVPILAFAFKFITKVVFGAEC